MAFEEEFNVEIPDDQAETIATVGDAVKFGKGDRGRQGRSLSARRHRFVSCNGLAFVRPCRVGDAALTKPSVADARRSFSTARSADERVVVTGLGMISPLACGVEPT